MVKRNRLKTALLGILLAATAVVFGRQALTVYGYSAAETLVLNAHVNALDRGSLLSGGFYFRGFPAVILTLHKLFGIRIFTLMRLFCFVTALLLVTGIYFLLCLLIRNCAVAFALALAPVAAAFLFPDRFPGSLFCTLPGVYGLAFLPPLIWFAILYFRQRQLLYLFLAAAAILFLAGPSAPTSVQPQETNGAIICLTNILNTEEKNTWTVVSAGDEREMIHTDGSHVESLDFLEAVEDTASAELLYIPTEDVFFFIEKRPLSGETQGLRDAFTKTGAERDMISESDAAQTLDYSAGSENYKGSARKILMAKMYAWVQKYQEMFPESCSAWYEDDEFLCVRVRQNPYRLQNFDTGFSYNNGE